MQAAMILCAGLGTRLRPLTDELPKPLVPVGDRPAVAHVVEVLRRARPDVRVVVNAHHRAGAVRAWAEPEGIAVSEETELLGTAGGVAAASSLLGAGDVLVWNGDIFAELDVEALARDHATAGAVEATLAVAPAPAGEGNVGVARDGRVTRLRKERTGDEASGGYFLGIHVLAPSIRASLPRAGCLVGDVYLPALRGGRILRAHPTTTPFLDVGTIDAYLDANRAWLVRRGVTSFVDAGATVADGVDVEGSVVGRGAVVNAPARRCVIWPGAVVDAPVADAVVTTRGVVTRA
jgi:mannose-1-phosphate guanylyltransferase